MFLHLLPVVAVVFGGCCVCCSYRCCFPDIALRGRVLRVAGMECELKAKGLVLGLAWALVLFVF